MEAVLCCHDSAPSDLAGGLSGSQMGGPGDAPAPPTSGFENSANASSGAQDIPGAKTMPMPGPSAGIAPSKGPRQAALCYPRLTCLACLRCLVDTPIYAVKIKAGVGNLADPSIIFLFKDLRTREVIV